MRSFLPITLTLCALFLAGVPGHAGTIAYTASGVYGADAPASWFTAPGSSFTMTFTIEQNPALNSDSGGSFWPTVADFHYFLDGIDLGVTESSMYFYSLSASGMFSVAFNPIVNPADEYGALIYLAGPQMYSGTTASPTMLTGTFLGTGWNQLLYVNGNWAGYQPDTLVTGVVAGAVPEPTSLALAIAPLALFWLRRRTRNA